MNKKDTILKKKILIVGASGHAKVIIDIIEKEGTYSIFGLIDTYKEKGIKIFSYSILGTENDIPKIIEDNDIYGAIIAIGDNFVRKKMYKTIIKITEKLNFISAIHPKAIISSDVSVGNGTVIMPGAIISSNSIIHDFCILNTKSILGRNCKMNEFSSLGPGSNVGAGVKIGDCTAVSLGAIIVEKLKVEKYCVIGAGSLVVNNVKKNKVVYGVPAKEIRDRKDDEYYLSGNRKAKR